jgi:hypothetical protein
MLDGNNGRYLERELLRRVLAGMLSLPEFVRREELMDYPEATFSEIIRSELQMAGNGFIEYGRYYENAYLATMLFADFFDKISGDRWVFARFVSQARKCLVLALLSAVRRHQAQSSMDVRQAIEASVFAAFSIEHPDYRFFLNSSGELTLKHSKNSSSKIYKWLNNQYNQHSLVLKHFKSSINEYAAHQNLSVTKAPPVGSGNPTRGGLRIEFG